MKRLTIPLALFGLLLLAGWLCPSLPPGLPKRLPPRRQEIGLYRSTSGFSPAMANRPPWMILSTPWPRSMRFW